MSEMTEMRQNNRIDRNKKMKKRKIEMNGQNCWILLAALSLLLVVFTVYRYPISIQDNYPVVFNMYIYIGLIRHLSSTRRASFDEFPLQELMVVLPSPWFPHSFFLFISFWVLYLYCKVFVYCNVLYMFVCPFHVCFLSVL